MSFDIRGRNEQIRREFEKLKQQGMKNREIFIILSEKYFLSESTINSIIYLQK